MVSAKSDVYGLKEENLFGELALQREKNTPKMVLKQQDHIYIDLFHLVK